MYDYDFTKLSPYEFERLTRDLLSTSIGVELSVFSSGKDNGIDLRYSTGVKDKIIVQCKRYAGYNNLIADLKKEAIKVRKYLLQGEIEFNDYYVVTSVGLTAPQQDTIASVFHGLIKSKKNIIDRNQLNVLLSKNQNIEKQYTKLRLDSIKIHERILHSDIINRSEFEMHKIQKIINYYVPNKSLYQASEILLNHNVIIISGIPGIGKTTLAKMLIFDYLNKGNYNLIAISEDINEGEKLFSQDPNEKQVFYYDDFLGSNFLNKGLVKNEDSRILNFIDKIKSNKNRKFIMTTREYILNQAKIQIESFHRELSMVNTYILDLGKYNIFEKASIFFNHLYYGGLSSAFFGEIVEEKKYYTIINHRNYNPRLIEYVSDAERMKKLHIKEGRYCELILEYLDNPHIIWEHAIKQITPQSIKVLYILFLVGVKICYDDLLKILETIYGSNKNEVNLLLKELEDCFISINKAGGNFTFIQFQNPSIADYINNYIQNDIGEVKNILSKNIYFDILLSSNLIHLKSNDINDFIKKTILSDGLKDMKHLLHEKSNKNVISYRAYRSDVEIITIASSRIHFMSKEDLENRVCVQLSECDYYGENDWEYLDMLYYDFPDCVKTNFYELLIGAGNYLSDISGVIGFIKLRDINASVFEEAISSGRFDLQNTIALIERYIDDIDTQYEIDEEIVPLIKNLRDVNIFTNIDEEKILNYAYDKKENLTDYWHYEDDGDDSLKSDKSDKYDTKDIDSMFSSLIEY